IRDRGPQLVQADVGFGPQQDQFLVLHDWNRIQIGLIDRELQVRRDTEVVRGWYKDLGLVQGPLIQRTAYLQLRVGQNRGMGLYRSRLRCVRNAIVKQQVYPIAGGRVVDPQPQRCAGIEKRSLQRGQRAGEVVRIDGDPGPEPPVELCEVDRSVEP